MPGKGHERQFRVEGGMRKVYFDYNATTPVHPDVAEAVGSFWGELFGNPSSLHWAGREVKNFYDGAREKIARVMNADPGEIVLTSGGTEGANHAIKGVASALGGKGKHIITSMVEHPCVLNTCRYLEEKGFKVTYLPVDGYGWLDPQKVAEAITEETILVTVMFANNETGTVMPIADIGAITRERGILFHSDMVQTIGKIPIDLKSLNVDIASFSGHKVYAPKGVGTIFIRDGVFLENFIHGGHQEGGRRAGTENVIGAVAFGKACEIVEKALAEERAHVGSLRQKLLDGIMTSVEDVRLNGHPTERLPNTLNLSFEYVEAESLLLALDMHGIAVSSGSACSSGSAEPSHVLLAMGIPPEVCQSAVRISLGRFNTEEDIEYALSVIPVAVRRLREMSPFSRGR